MKSSGQTSVNDLQSTQINAEDELTIVGIGASAGGLQALEHFFKNIAPSRSPTAYVVVQHLSPEQPSMMDHLLKRHTSLNVQQAVHEARVLPGHIYVIPPGKDMIIADGKLLIADRSPDRGLSLPIDQFFRSLAQERGRHSVGVILSGTGTDGSRGICEIHAAGGLVLAQAPSSASFDGMPNAAIETGVVDDVLAPEEMATQIRSFSQRSSEVLDGSLTGMDVASTEVNAKQVFRLLRNKYGIDFSHYKSGTVTRRIERRLMLNQVYDLASYAERLAKEPEELDKLYRDLLIGVTRFFRDPEGFEIIQSDVLRPLIQNADPNDELRFWIAGTGTGQEAYSLAIQISEELEQLPHLVPTRIFATDVHHRSLETAARGIYSEDDLRDVSADRVANFFTKRRDGYQVSPHIRKMIVFAPHNIIRDAPFTGMDFISCRNLLIYLQPEAQKKAFSLFHFALKVGWNDVAGPQRNPRRTRAGIRCRT